MTERPDQVPCVFRGSFVREQVDPRIKEAWPGRAPWGDLRKTWKTQHCLRVNPTGYPEDCPYSEEDCAMSFLQAALIVASADRPGAMFRVLAANRGAERADNRPLARDRVPTRRTSDMGLPRETGEVRVVAAAPDQALHGRRTAPVSIGSLLGSYDPRPRQGRSHDGEEGS